MRYELYMRRWTNKTLLNRWFVACLMKEGILPLLMIWDGGVIENENQLLRWGWLGNEDLAAGWGLDCWMRTPSLDETALMIGGKDVPFFTSVLTIWKEVSGVMRRNGDHTYLMQQRRREGFSSLIRMVMFDIVSLERQLLSSLHNLLPVTPRPTSSSCAESLCHS